VPVIFPIGNYSHLLLNRTADFEPYSSKLHVFMTFEILYPL